jgi:hypothetical protein
MIPGLRLRASERAEELGMDETEVLFPSIFVFPKS